MYVRYDVTAVNMFNCPNMQQRNGSHIREFKKPRRQLQRKRYIKIELWVKLSLLRLFHVDHVVQNRRTDFRLLGTNGFHVKAKSERSAAASSRCCQNLKYENFTS